MSFTSSCEGEGFEGEIATLLQDLACFIYFFRGKSFFWSIPRRMQR